MSSIDCTIHLVTLKPETTKDALLQHLVDPSAGAPSYLIKAKAHGWVHLPHQSPHRKILLAHSWDVFLLTQEPNLPASVGEIVSAHFSLKVAIPQSQYDELVSQIHARPKPNLDTPALPNEWPKGGGIPPSKITAPTDAPLKPGELRLDPPMAKFLSGSLPSEVANEPVALMNLFKYPNGDPKVHEHYMDGFKSKFGNAAGVSMKYMGPVKSVMHYANYEAITDETEPSSSSQTWDDANLVQYDTIWHYAYMLSTETYSELNKEKISGLEDTCILLTSAIELAQ